MGAPLARVRLEGDRLAVVWPAMAACTDLVARCVLRDGTVHESSSWASAGTTGGSYLASCGPLDVALSLRPAGDCVRMEVEATTRPAVQVSEVTVAAGVAGAGTELRWVLANGYQSSDPSGHVPAAGGARESWWTIGLADDRGAGIAAAAEWARSSCTKFEVAGGVLSTTWREAEMLEARPLLFGGQAEGTRWRGDPVLIAAGRDVRARLGALLPGPARPAPAPVGWLSWYHHGPWVRRQDVLASADVLASDEYRRLGYRVVLVDDGWQQTNGEWRPNTKFPGGLPAICADLAGRGLQAGLWSAPFLVSGAAQVAREAPGDWFVLDPATGERAIDPRHRVFGPMHVLDASRPAVQAHLRESFASFYEAGIRYCKIDFLYAGAYAGLGALRAGLEAIRAGARDAHLIASGAPLLPVAGLVESCRVGPDTATPMHDFETGVSAPTVFGDEVMAVARNVAARAMLRRWFSLDADVALVGGNLSLEQGRQLTTLAALSGGPFFASDDLERLPNERLDLLRNPEVMSLVGGAAALPDWEPDGSGRPATHWRRGDVLAVYNWRSEPADVPVRAPGARGARDLWARSEVEEFGDGTVLAVPAQGVRLLRLR